MTLCALKVDDFTAALASTRAAPGGGAAAALAGALAASLGTMSARCSLLRAEDAELAALAGRMEELRGALLPLVDADGEAYRAYMAAKATTDPSRADAVEKARLAAAQPPLCVLRFACETVELLEKMLPRCKKALWPDVAVAASLARAALSAAAVTLRANALGESPAAKELLEETKAALAAYIPRADALYAAASEWN